MFISQASKNDFINWAKSNSEDYIVTFLGISPHQSSQYHFSTIHDNYILYVGGIDFRKNIDGALQAFALAKKKHKKTFFDETVFKLVCNVSIEEKSRIHQLLKKLEIDDSTVFCGYVSDQELPMLYKRCGVFFFPSLYEGFGLPVLEALSYGCHVLSGNNSSLPEVGGDFVEYCDPSDLDTVSDQLYHSLETGLSESQDIRNERISYSHQFNWDKTAITTLEFLSKHKLHKPHNIKRLAILTPWPNQKSGIAKYVFRLLPEIKKYFDITLFIDDTRIKTTFLKMDGVTIYSINEYETKHLEFDETIYHLGNSTDFHTEIYKMADKYPGIIELHDTNIHIFLQHLSFYSNNTRDKKYYLTALDYYGEKGKTIRQQVENTGTFPDWNEFSMVEHICSRSKHVIVHNKDAIKKLKQFKHISYIPLACFEPKQNISDEEKFQFRNKFSVSENSYLISCLGFINKNKRYEKIIEAVARLKHNGYPVHLLFLGESVENQDDVYRLARKFKIDENVMITGFLDDENYFNGISASDVIINLRYPSMGESSATLRQSFSYAKPTLISNIDQYRSFPHEAVWKVDVSRYEVDQIYAYLVFLLQNPQIRNALGENGRNLANYNFCVNNVVQLYIHTLSTL
jgi:glycosyltransferase involved in cell wall biosynthesis